MILYIQSPNMRKGKFNSYNNIIELIIKIIIVVGMNIKENIIWYEKYRPQTFADYVFANEELKYNVNKWLSEKELPHLFIMGSSGTGKTTLVNLLIKEMGLEEDNMIINASKTNGIDDVRDMVSSFAPLNPINAKFKVIVFEECENLTDQAQNALKMLIEQYNSACRFIFVCNEPRKIKEPIKARCQIVQIDQIDKKQLCIQIVKILQKEQVAFELDVLAPYIDKFYPNIRQILNYIQYNSQGGQLLPLQSYEDGNVDLYQKTWELFKSFNLMNGRKIISSEFAVEDITKMYKWIADNIPTFTINNVEQFQAFQILKEGMYEATSSIDPEICLSGTIVKICLTLYNKGK